MINLAPSETNIWRIVQAILSLSRGGSNAVGTVTLRAGQTSTSVTVVTSPAAVNVAPGMRVFLEPTTANAASVRNATYVSSVGQQQFVVTHPSDANADKTFAFEVRG